jgi:hypothetical protein
MGGGGRVGGPARHRYRTNHEIESGFVASANGRHSGNAFVTEVAGDCMLIFDRRSVIAGNGLP